MYALVLFLAFLDLGTVKSEPDLNKRSELALANADRAIDDARKAFQAGDDKAIQAALVEVDQSVALCYDALEQTHSSPRKSRFYKQAELKMRALLRRLAGLRDEVGFETRQPVESVIRKLSDVHDELLSDIMSKKK
jgi:hypothetical protein